MIHNEKKYFTFIGWKACQFCSVLHSECLVTYWKRQFSVPKFCFQDRAAQCLMGAGLLCMGVECLYCSKTALKSSSNSTDRKSTGIERCNPCLLSVTLRCWTGEQEHTFYNLEVACSKRACFLERVIMDEHQSWFRKIFIAFWITKDQISPGRLNFFVSTDDGLGWEKKLCLLHRKACTWWFKTPSSESVGLWCLWWMKTA